MNKSPEGPVRCNVPKVLLKVTKDTLNKQKDKTIQILKIPLVSKFSYRWNMVPIKYQLNF
jgi:hypothetical protein